MPFLRTLGQKLRQCWRICLLRTAPARDKLHYQFIHHPEATGETYLEHLCFTIRMSARLVFVSFVLLIHGIFPFLLVRTGSSQMEAIWHILEKRKKQTKQPVPAPTESTTAAPADAFHGGSPHAEQ